MLNSQNLENAQEASDMDMNSIETANLNAMMAEQELLDWLNTDEEQASAEEPADRSVPNYA